MTDVDMVNHPPHYTSHPSGIEVIQVTRNCSFDIGNAIKYMLRHNHKGAAMQDLEKALWYLNDHNSKYRFTQGLPDPTPINQTGLDYLDRIIQSEIVERTLPGYVTLSLLSLHRGEFLDAAALLETYIESESS